MASKTKKQTALEKRLKRYSGETKDNLFVRILKSAFWIQGLTVILVVGGTIYSMYAFIKGRPFTLSHAVSLNYLDTEFDHYHGHAFAVDSTTWLALFGWLLWSIIVGIFIFLEKRSPAAKKMERIVIPIFTGLGIVLNITALVLVAIYQSNGVVAMNFSHGTTNDFNYGFAYTIPLLFLAVPVSFGIISLVNKDKKARVAAGESEVS